MVANYTFAVTTVRCNDQDALFEPFSKYLYYQEKKYKLNYYDPLELDPKTLVWLEEIQTWYCTVWSSRSYAENHVLFEELVRDGFVFEELTQQWNTPLHLPKMELYYEIGQLCIKLIETSIHTRPFMTWMFSLSTRLSTPLKIKIHDCFRWHDVADCVQLMVLDPTEFQSCHLQIRIRDWLSYDVFYPQFAIRLRLYKQWYRTVNRRAVFRSTGLPLELIDQILEYALEHGPYWQPTVPTLPQSSWQDCLTDWWDTPTPDTKFALEHYQGPYDPTANSNGLRFRDRRSNTMMDIWSLDLSHCKLFTTTLDKLFHQLPVNGLFRIRIRGLDNWDVSSVTSAVDAFAYINLHGNDLRRWNTAKLENANGMFNCARWNGNGIQAWDVRQLRRARAMLAQVNMPMDLILGWQLDNVKDVQDMCVHLVFPRRPWALRMPKCDNPTAIGFNGLYYWPDGTLSNVTK